MLRKPEEVFDRDREWRALDRDLRSSPPSDVLLVPLERLSAEPAR